MNPKIWGKSGWIILFNVAQNYPSNPSVVDKNFYKDFFMNTKNILPCQICRQNYEKHLRQLPIDPHLSNTQNLFDWLLNIHNLTNSELHKPKITATQARNFYVQDNSLMSAIWKFLFAVAIGYPKNPSPKNIHDYKKFFRFLKYVIPDQSFRQNYSYLFDNQLIDPYLQNNQNLLIWVKNIYYLMTLKNNGKIIPSTQKINQLSAHQIQIDNEKQLNEKKSTYANLLTSILIITLILIIIMKTNKIIK